MAVVLLVACEEHSTLPAQIVKSPANKFVPLIMSETLPLLEIEVIIDLSREGVWLLSWKKVLLLPDAETDANEFSVTVIVNDESTTP